MDPKIIDQLLKEKLSDVKEQKRHEQMVGLVALLGESISEDIKNAVSQVKIDVPKAQVDVNIPEIKIPDIPAPQVTVNVPEIKLPEFKFEVPPAPEAKVTVEIPEIKVPEPKVTVNVEKQDPPIVNIPPFPEEMRVFGDVNLAGIDRKNPMPVQMVDGKGNPMSFPVSGGGRGDFFTIKDIHDSAGNSIIDRETGAMKITGAISVSAVAQSSVSLVNSDGNYYNSDNPLPVSGSFSSTPYGTYFASDAVGSVNVVQSITLDVKQLSGSSDSVNVLSLPDVTVTSITNSTATSLLNGDGGTLDPRDRNWTITETVPISAGTTLDVRQVSGANWSISVSDVFGSTGTNVVNPDGRLKVELPSGASGLTDTELRASSLDVRQVSGSSDSVNVLSMPAVTVTSITNSTAVTLLNGEGLARDSWLVSDITNSVKSALIDSTGIQYSGSNPVPVSVQRALESIGLDVMTVRQVSGASDSVSVLSMPAIVVTSITNSTASALVDSTGVQYSGSNPVPTKEVRSATPSQTSPSVGVASTSVLASNTSRLGATIYNEGSAICYLKLGSTASLTSYSIQIASGGYYELPFGYTGAVDGITSASTAQLRVTELT